MRRFCRLIGIRCRHGIDDAILDHGVEIRGRRLHLRPGPSHLDRPEKALLHGLIELPATDTQQAQADRGLALVEGFVPGQKVTRP